MFTDQLSINMNLSGKVKSIIANTSAELTSVENNGQIEISFAADPGLYQFSVISDAREFNWEELYLDLYKYNNKGQRTGPWDFHLLEDARALIPSYWVSIDGKELGLWYFQRVSIDDVKHKRFRGRMAFYTESAGSHILTLKPYNNPKIEWLSATLEEDPEDRLDALPDIPQDWMERCPASCWKRHVFWKDLKVKLDTTHNLYKKPLEQSFLWIESNESHEPVNLPLIIAKYYLTDSESSLITVIRIIENEIQKEHWGNQRSDGYGHDGDMNAMYTFLSLSLSYHYLYNKMDNDLKKRLIDKLQLQGRRFFNKILLYRDYWGGSLLQDHGWKSLFGFGCAVLHLLGVIPEARLWASYIIPRLDRSLKAMPQDGVIPASSHYSIHLYMEFTMQYRDALLSLTRRDILADEKIHRIIDYVAVILREKEIEAVGWGIDNVSFVGGCDFFNLMASMYNDGRAAYIQKLLLELPEFEFYHATQKHAYYNSVLWGLLNYEPSVKPVTSLSRTNPLSYFDDSGVVHYRDDDNGATLSLHCGPSFGYNAYKNAKGPCDRLGLGPGAGHFMLAVNGKPILVTPDGGYRLLTEIRNCMLIDDKGQKDNIGYTMSVPSYKYEGEEIIYADWDESKRTGRICLNLTPVYPEEMGVAAYTREFVIGLGKRLIIRDYVVLDEERKLSWLFHTKGEQSIQFRNLSCQIGKNPYINITPNLQGIDLTASEGESPVVWSYSSHNRFKPFRYVRYDTAKKTQSALVDFIIEW